MRIFRLTQRFPPEERHGLSCQMRNSSQSICANLAEAWRKRRYEAAFVSKLSDADAEAAETLVWVDMAFDCHYIDRETDEELKEVYDRICRMLTRTMQDSARWCSSRPER